MAGYLVLAVLAAFGVLSLLWALFGWLLPVCREGWILCPGKPGELSNVYVYLWLRSMGIVKCPLILADLGLSEKERAWLTEKGIEICSLAELSERLGIGAETT
ncbi:MAG: hypothetical protein ACI4PH_09870 [Faecousia sp.]